MTTAVVVLLCVVAFGLLTGMLSGVLGVGGGIFVVPFLVLAIGTGQHAAQATSLVMVLPTALIAVITLQRRGIGDLRTVVTIGAIGAGGSLIGAVVALHLPGAALRLAFAVVLVVVGIRLLVDGLRLRRAP